MVAYVTSPANQERLDAIRATNLARVAGTSASADSSGPTIVWLSYNVHGNESVSTEASMATLYALVNPENEQTSGWLADVVVVMDPCLNPDGRERYVQWYRQTRGRTPNPLRAAREHDEPWPGGRTNHYYFDLNRDWAWGIQQETRARLARYQAWMPHLHVDFHEQSIDAPYYFAPAAEPFHAHITDWQREAQAEIGRNHARYFDDNGWLYFTRERFDLFYPSYGDTWPTFNGAVGMTYEQGGSGAAGLAVRTTEGDTLTLRDRIDHHHTTGLSTVEVAARQRQALIREFTAYFEEARMSPPGTYRTYVIKGSNAPGRLMALAAHLDEQGIAYGYATTARRDSGFAYHSGQQGPADIDPGDLLVSVYQPHATLVQTLFEPEPTLADSLTYDITAWALPYAYNLEAYALTDSLGTGTAQPPARSDVQASAGGGAPYAYLLEWQSMEEAGFLSQVLQAGVRVRFAERAFEIDGRRYAPGTLILTRRGNEALGEAFDRVVREAASALSQPLRMAASGFVTSGADFGSSDVRFLEKPRVAMLSGDPVSAYALGEVWHFFDQQIRYPVTLIGAEGFQVADVQDFDVLVLPSGSYDDLLTLECLTDLKAWVRRGGRLIAMERALSSLAGQEGFGLSSKESDTDTDSLTQNTGRYGNRDREAISEDVPGSIHRLQMDASHPLAFGFGATYPTLKRSDDAYAYLKDGWNVGLLQGSGQPASGFAGYKAQQKLTDTLVFGVEDMGRGSVTYLVDNPLFRGFWHGGKLIFANAVFLVGQ